MKIEFFLQEFDAEATPPEPKKNVGQTIVLNEYIPPLIVLLNSWPLFLLVNIVILYTHYLHHCDICFVSSFKKKFNLF